MTLLIENGADVTAENRRRQTPGAVTHNVRVARYINDATQRYKVRDASREGGGERVGGEEKTENTERERMKERTEIQGQKDRERGRETG